MFQGKRLYRIERGAKLTGVCGGIGEYFNIDINLVRLVWILGTLMSAGAGILLYLAGSLLLPKKSDIYPGY